MALINCIECTKSISDLAEICPHCGAPVELSKKALEKKPEVKCFECENILKEGEEVCTNCGVNQSLNTKVEVAENDIPVKETPEKVAVIKNDLNAGMKKNEKKTVVPPKIEEPKERIKIQQAPKKSKWFRNLIIVIAILLGLAFVGFKMLPNNTQRDMIQGLGLEQSEFVGSNSMSSYVELGEVVSRNTLFGKWGITGTMINVHPDKTIYSVTIRFKFSDGDEERTKNVKMKSNDLFPKLFDMKIDGHKGASFYGAEVISAN